MPTILRLKFNTARETAAQVPEPAGIMLFGAGLLALGLTRRFRAYPSQRRKAIIRKSTFRINFRDCEINARDVSR